MDYQTGFFEYMKKTVSPYHAVQAGEKLLKDAGFTEVQMSKPFVLQAGGRYYVRSYGTTLMAFTIGKDFEANKEKQAFHIAAAHTDFPCLHIKPKAEMTQLGYLRLDAEVYGGPILNTWLDRPLSIAGRVALRSESVFEPKMVLYDAGRPLLTIPNMAIHINREVNKGYELKKQLDMLPLFGLAGNYENVKKESFFVDFLANELQCEAADILDFDLYVYNAEEGTLLGPNREMYSCPRLDNHTSCYALLKAVMDGNRADGINIITLNDNEEVGSQTKQGADSAMLTMLLEKIYAGFGMDKAALDEAVFRSFLFSVDVAHALHPNHPEKYDPVNYALLNDGVMFKINSNQRYTYDGEAVAIAQQLCENANVKYKKFVNHSDAAGGSTLGPLLSSWLPMKTVDIGIPLLAMHSARELMGIEDEEQLIRMMTAFFKA